ncbi:hypothetical protein [Streptomyces sp. ScaeMP-e48]|uniref:hypothetical protein n=1 Tax=Streptomyces sp. ScaeMP-e48 TaxID=1100823 RepID=UPI000C0525D0|nr:hypothetical protein [Streptomyces sp. ScaeMP-e48]
MPYDGTNGEAVADWVGNATLVEVAGDGTLVLSVTAYGLTYDVATRPGWQVLRFNGMHYGSLSPEDYAQQYCELPPA